MTAEEERPEKWVVVLVVDREAVGTPLASAEVDPPGDWGWSALTGAGCEVVMSERFAPGDSLRVEVDDDAVWLSQAPDGEVSW